MTRLALLIFAVWSIAIGFLSLADRLDDDLRISTVDLSEPVDEGMDANRLSALEKAPMGRTSSRSGDSIECYICTDCPKILLNTTTKICPYNYEVTKQRKCVVYVEQYKHMKRPWYIRGCASERGSCADIKRTHAGHADVMKLLSCSDCEGDRCNTNGVARSLSDLTMACISLIVTPIFAKYTLA